jgi:hypothetical protein
LLGVYGRYVMHACVHTLYTLQWHGVHACMVCRVCYARLHACTPPLVHTYSMIMQDKMIQWMTMQDKIIQWIGVYGVCAMFTCMHTKVNGTSPMI